MGLSSDPPADQLMTLLADLKKVKEENSKLKKQVDSAERQRESAVATNALHLSLILDLRQKLKDREDSHAALKRVRESNQYLELEVARLAKAAALNVIENHDVVTANENEYLLVSEKYFNLIQDRMSHAEELVARWWIFGVIVFSVGVSLGSIAARLAM